MTKQATPNAPFELVRIQPDHPLWADTTHYVHERYVQAFHANIQGYMPEYYALVNETGLQAVCGVRQAAQAPLFLEQYLDAQAEQLLTQCFQQEIQRQELVEFGQLASFSKGLSGQLILRMLQDLRHRGFMWSIFTATDVLHALMRRFHIPTHILAEARAEKIEHAEKIWGNYYTHHPRILGASLQQGLEALSPTNHTSNVA